MLVFKKIMSAFIEEKFTQALFDRSGAEKNYQYFISDPIYFQSNAH